MTPEFIERARKDFCKEEYFEDDWKAFLAGYIAATKRFGQREDRREIRSKQGYARVGLNNV